MSSLLVRFAVPDDRGAIEAICLHEYEQLRARFDEIAPVKLIENALMAVVVTDADGAVLACAMFNDTPPATDLHAEPWFDALNGNRSDSSDESAAPLSSVNTLWLTFFVSEQEVSVEACNMLFQSTFSTLPDTEWIVYPQPSGVPMFEPIQSTFDLLNPDAIASADKSAETKWEAEEEGLEAWGGSSSPSTAAYLVLNRDKYVAPLTIREATIEDCDDLTIPLEAQSINLQSMFGSEYFIAELIRAQSEETRVFAAETKQIDEDGGEVNRALGVISVTSVVDPGMVKSMQQSFDLRAFGGLVKVDDSGGAPASLASAASKAAAAMSEEERAAADKAITSIEPVQWSAVLSFHLDPIVAMLEKWSEKVATNAGIDVAKLKKAKRALLLDGEVPVAEVKLKLTKLLLTLGDAAINQDVAERAVGPLIALLSVLAVNAAAAAEAEAAAAAEAEDAAAPAAEAATAAEDAVPESKEEPAPAAEADAADDEPAKEGDDAATAAAAESDAATAPAAASAAPAAKAATLKVPLRAVLDGIRCAPRIQAFTRWLRQHTKSEVLRTVGRAFSLETTLSPSTLCRHIGMMWMSERYVGVAGVGSGSSLATDAAVTFKSFGGANSKDEERTAAAILEDLYNATAMRAVLPSTSSSSSSVRLAAAEWMGKWWGCVIVDASKATFLAARRGTGASALAARLTKPDAQERGWIIVNASPAQVASVTEEVGAIALHLTLREEGRAAPPTLPAGLLDPLCSIVSIELSDGACKDIARLQRILLREVERTGASATLGCGQSLLQLEPQLSRVADLSTFALEYAEGAPNIFAIVFFCIDELYETRAVDMLQSAFDAFPDRDYCIITVPHTTHEPPLFRIFSRVDALPGSTYSHVLYVCHRFSLLALKEFTVRRATADDFPAIEQQLTPGINSAVRKSMVDAARQMLVDVTAVGGVAATKKSGDAGAGADGGGSLVERALAADVESIVGGADVGAAVRNRYSALATDGGDALLVAEVEGQVIGALVLRESAGTTGRGSDFIGNDIAAQFNLPDLVAGAEAHPPSERAAVTNLVMNPIFKWRRRFFIQEAMRLERKALLAMQVFPVGSTKGSGEGTPFELLEELVPLENREKAQLVDNGAAELEALLSAHCMALVTRRILAEPKRVNNARIVVAGTSDTALAIVSVLLSIAHLHLPNLTLLIESELPTGQVRAEMLTDLAAMLAPRTAFSARAIRAMALARRCNVLRGSIAGLDRVNKCVKLAPDSDGGSERWAGAPGMKKRGAKAALRLLPYDMLVLAPDVADVTRQRLSSGAEGSKVIKSAELYARMNVHFLTDVTSSKSAAAAVKEYGAAAAEFAAEEEKVDPTLVETARKRVAQRRSGALEPLPSPEALESGGPWAVVYGSSLRALSAVNALLVAGVPSRKIMYFRCAPVSLGDSNTQLMERVSKAISELGVVTVDRARLIGVERASGGNATSIATFGPAESLELAYAAAERKGEGSNAGRKQKKAAKQKSTMNPYASAIAIGQLSMSASASSSRRTGSAASSRSIGERGSTATKLEQDGTATKGGRSWPLEVPCGILLCADREEIDPTLFACIDRNGLPFDGHLVVNTKYQTIDESIYAAGPVAKPSRATRRPSPFSRFSPIEVATQLASSLLKVIDPETMEELDSQHMDRGHFGGEGLDEEEASVIDDEGVHHHHVRHLLLALLLRRLRRVVPLRKLILTVSSPPLPPPPPPTGTPRAPTAGHGRPSRPDVLRTWIRGLRGCPSALADDGCVR